MKLPEILVLYYSRGGKTAALAAALRAGIDASGDCTARVRTVPPLDARPDSIPDHGPPYVEKTDLTECIGLALGSPTRFGNMAAPLKAFLDSTSDLWLSGSLIDKPAAVFTATSSLHGGQESTLLSMTLPLLHHGMVIVGVPYSEAELSTTKTGGTPYGASHVSWGRNPDALSGDEKRVAQALGRRVADVAQRLDAG